MWKVLYFMRCVYFAGYLMIFTICCKYHQFVLAYLFYILISM